MSFDFHQYFFLQYVIWCSQSHEIANFSWLTCLTWQYLKQLIYYLNLKVREVSHKMFLLNLTLRQPYSFPPKNIKSQGSFEIDCALQHTNFFLLVEILSLGQLLYQIFHFHLLDLFFIFLDLNFLVIIIIHAFASNHLYQMSELYVHDPHQNYFFHFGLFLLRLFLYPLLKHLMAILISIYFYLEFLIILSYYFHLIISVLKPFRMLRIYSLFRLLFLHLSIIILILFFVLFLFFQHLSLVFLQNILLINELHHYRLEVIIHRVIVIL